MSRIRIAPIVEGHGEVVAARTLLMRVWHEIVRGEFIDVLRPVRQPRSKLLRRDSATGRTEPEPEEIHRAIKLAAMKLGGSDDPSTPALVLLLIDADEDCPRHAVEALRNVLADAKPAIDLAVVFACVEYETWFVAAAESLREYVRLQPGNDNVVNPELQRLGKSWIESRFLGTKYSETVDQVKLTAAMDLGLCRQRCPSFDKLCRELENRAKSAPGRSE